MTISTGDNIPDIELFTMGAQGPEKTTTGAVLGTGRVVLFAVPGAFTPGCSKVHLPGFVQQAAELTGKGVDRIACISVNDAFVMGAWAEDQGVGESIVMLADGNGEFTEAMGLVMDGTGFGLGTRSKRYAAIIEDGVVTSIEVDENGGVEVSACSAVLDRL
ncbi:AHP1 Peroxiredoxin [Acidimicrobiia bacterium]|jgi:peroxiredoxin